MQSYDQTATDQVIEKTAQAMRDRGFVVEVVDDGAQALEWLQHNIPAGAEVMTGSSTTLNEIGFSEYLESGQHQWNNVHAQIQAEHDEAKRHELRRKSVTSEYFVASANALAETGEIVAADNSGSRVGAYPHGAEHLILVVGTQKIAPDLQSAMQRVREYVFPLEDKRAQKAYGINSSMSKWVILESEKSPNRTTVVLVKEKLGY